MELGIRPAMETDITEESEQHGLSPGDEAV